MEVGTQLQGTKATQERGSKWSALEVKRQELDKQQQALLAKHRIKIEKLQATCKVWSG